MRISDWSSDVCSSDLPARTSFVRKPRRPDPARDHRAFSFRQEQEDGQENRTPAPRQVDPRAYPRTRRAAPVGAARSEEHTSELQSLMRISYAVFCLKNKMKDRIHNNNKI